MISRMGFLAAAASVCMSSAVYGQDLKPVPRPASADEDHAIVFELGVAPSWEHAERAIHTGGTFAFEVTPIEHWLELEIGVTAIPAGGSVEMPFDVLFKKPWQFSPRFEFMLGAGPEIVHASGGSGATFWGWEGVLDFMFWPKKNVGWYVEPSYEITFRAGMEHHGVGVAIGLLIGR